MEWSRSETIALAMRTCMKCHGLGLRPSHGNLMKPCHCVLRAIFRACYARFRYCVSKERYMARTSLEHNPGRQGKLAWGRKDEEYIADFCLVSRRALTDFEYKIFKYHFLLGADWKLCSVRLKIDRGNFFHAVYRIEQKLGLVFRELRPYGLFPLQSYFQSADGTWEDPDLGPAWARPHRRPPGSPALHPPLLHTA